MTEHEKTTMLTNKATQNILKAWQVQSTYQHLRIFPTISSANIPEDFTRFLSHIGRVTLLVSRLDDQWLDMTIWQSKPASLYVMKTRENFRKRKKVLALGNLIIHRRYKVHISSKWYKRRTRQHKQ